MSPNDLGKDLLDLQNLRQEDFEFRWAHAIAALIELNADTSKRLMATLKLQKSMEHSLSEAGEELPAMLRQHAERYAASATEAIIRDHLKRWLASSFAAHTKTMIAHLRTEVRVAVNAEIQSGMETRQAELMAMEKQAVATGEASAKRLEAAASRLLKAAEAQADAANRVTIKLFAAGIGGAVLGALFAAILVRSL